MLVHAVIGLAPLAAAAFVFQTGSVTVAGIEPDAWTLLLRGALVGMLVISVPSVWTGIFERKHMYVNWPRSHRIKLALSVALVVVLAVELAAMLASDAPLRLGSWLGLAVVVLNCVVVFLLSAFGLRITLGRQSWGGTSYLADMDFDPPVDILDCVADFAGDPPKLIDVRGEG